jgi:hypothetical protein
VKPERLLWVQGGVDLVDHILESLRLIENRTLLDETLSVVEKLGFIKAGKLL